MKLTIINQENFEYTIYFNKEKWAEQNYSDPIPIKSKVVINEYTYYREGVLGLNSLTNFEKSLSKAYNKSNGSSIFYNDYEDSNVSITFNKEGKVRIILHHTLDEKTRLFRTDDSTIEAFSNLIEDVTTIIEEIKQK